MDDQQNSRTYNQDYLGIPTNTKLPWQPHINNVQNKVRKTLGLIKRTLYAAPPQVRKTAYEVFVRPTLEYAACAWSPYTKTDIQKVEQVQRSAARFITGDYRRTSGVSAMCANLMWDTLHTRRCIRDAALFYKIHNGQARISLPTIINTADAHTRRHHEHCQPPAYLHSFYVRSTKMWNSLTHEEVTVPTAVAFQKAALEVIKSS